METKNAQVRRLVSEGQYKQALGICKEWRNGIKKEDTETLRTGYECMLYPRFYKQLGYDPSVEISKSIEVLKRLYG